MLLNLFVKGLYVGALYLLIIVLSAIIFPGKLAQAVFSPLGVLVLFALFVLEMLFDFLKVGD